MTEPKHPAWMRHLDVIGDELMRLLVICDVNLREPGVLDRIVKNDATVCGKNNPIGFKKLRELVIATFDSLNKASDRVGPAETQKMIEVIRERMDRQRQLGGTAKKGPGAASDKAKR